MRSSPVRFAVFSFVIIALAFWFVSRFYVQLHPLGGLYLPLSAPEVSERAYGMLREMGLTVTDTRAKAYLVKDDALTRQIYQRHGIVEGNRLLRDSIAGYSWRLYWKRRADGILEAGDPGESVAKAEAVIDLKKAAGSVRLQLGPRGNMIDFDRRIEDTLRLPDLSLEEARKVASSAVGQAFPEFQGVAPTREKRTDLGYRTDYEFFWTVNQPALGNQGEVRTRIAGNVLVRLSRDYNVTSASLPGDQETFHGIVEAIILVLAVILIIVVGIRRVRAYEISFRSGLALGVFVGLCYAAQLLLEARAETGWWYYILIMLLAPLFFGGVFAITWAVAESVGRETMPEKFTVFDLLGKGHVFHSRVGSSLLAGVASGIGILAVLMGVIWLLNLLIPGSYIDVSQSVLSPFSSISPAFYTIFHSITADIFGVVVFIVFLLAFLRKSVPVWAMVLIGIAVFGLINGSNAQPLLASLLLSLMLGVLFVGVYLRSDVLVSFLSLVTFTLVGQGYSLLTVGNAVYLQSALGVGSILVAIVVVGLVGVFTKDRAVDLEAITPAFVRHITERERLQRELEIARDVQMSMLPKRDPDFPGIDIASRCVPALEVGGDYYDFILLPDGNFGVAVGDVSGKGTQAAFFMTLTKGFLRAVTKVCQSPAAVLTQMNSLFCENVERGTFISMVYGIFDMRRRVLTVARAGHNPVINRRFDGSRVELIHPKGIALGLEDGPTFRNSIQEREIPFKSGDLFVFYTDGCSEAMNKKQEEFGEERLRDVVAQHAASSSGQVLEEIFAEVNRHAGHASQHDDMTLVVVRIV